MSTRMSKAMKEPRCSRAGRPSLSTPLSSARPSFDRRDLLRCLAVASLAGLIPGDLRAQAGGDAGFDALFTPEVRSAIENGLNYLVDQQNDDGSFGVGHYSRNVAVCSLCAMAMLANGSAPGRGPFGEALDRTIAFVLGSVQESGFINQKQFTSRGPMYGHGFATLMLAEVYGMSRAAGLRGKLVDAVKLIVASQNDEGGWRYQPRQEDADISVTVCQIMALRAARNAGLYVPNETVDRAVAYVRQCQNPDGGFAYFADQPSDSAFPRSAAGIVALNSAGIYEGDEIQRGIAYLLQFPPKSNGLGQTYYFYGHYYAVQVMWHAGGRYWQMWYPAIRDVLLRHQSRDGHWSDLISREYGTAMACLILQMPSNYLPIFDR